jgi:hypothetical protein
VERRWNDSRLAALRLRKLDMRGDQVNDAAQRFGEHLRIATTRRGHRLVAFGAIAAWSSLAARALSTSMIALVTRICRYLGEGDDRVLNRRDHVPAHRPLLRKDGGERCVLASAS